MSVSSRAAAATATNADADAEDAYVASGTDDVASSVLAVLDPMVIL